LRVRGRIFFVFYATLSYRKEEKNNDNFNVCWPFILMLLSKV
jgi:hypothetical protein